MPASASAASTSCEVAHPSAYRSIVSRALRTASSSIRCQIRRQVATEKSRNLRVVLPLPRHFSSSVGSVQVSHSDSVTVALLVPHYLDFAEYLPGSPGADPFDYGRLA